jgi:hypothetical protein
MTDRNHTDQPDQPNGDEGASPSADTKKQNPGETTTADLTDDEDDELED